MDSALIGCGYIGTLISEYIAEESAPINLKVIFDRNKDKMQRIQSLFETPPAIAQGIEDIKDSKVDVVIEAASIGAVHAFAEQILSTGKSMMIMSVGAFSDPGFYKRIESLCRKHASSVYLPTGAIGALDAVSAASMDQISNVKLTTFKHPRSLEGAPYIKKHGLALSNLKDSKTIFRGNALEAIKGFPANVNVAIALSLVGVGAERTQVEIVADPGLDVNVHQVEASGDFGRLFFKAENNPSVDNPRTSYLAALSAVSTLKKIVSPIKIG